MFCISPPHKAAIGLVMAAEKRGFCRSSAHSKVDPDRGKPEIKWKRDVILSLYHYPNGEPRPEDRLGLNSPRSPQPKPVANATPMRRSAAL